MLPAAWHHFWCTLEVMLPSCLWQKLRIQFAASKSPWVASWLVPRRRALEWGIPHFSGGLGTILEVKLNVKFIWSLTTLKCSWNLFQQHPMYRTKANKTKFWLIQVFYYDTQSVMRNVQYLLRHKTKMSAYKLWWFFPMINQELCTDTFFVVDNDVFVLYSPTQNY